MVDSSGLENRHSSLELSRVRIPLSPFTRSIELFPYFIGFARPGKIKGMARLGEIAEPEKKMKLDRNV